MAGEGWEAYILDFIINEYIGGSTRMTNNTNATIDQFRQSLGAVDPAALTGSDVRALLDLVQASMEARGVQ